MVTGDVGFAQSTTLAIGVALEAEGFLGSCVDIVEFFLRGI